MWTSPTGKFLAYASRAANASEKVSKWNLVDIFIYFLNNLSDSKKKPEVKKSHRFWWPLTPVTIGTTTITIWSTPRLVRCHSWIRLLHSLLNKISLSTLLAGEQRLAEFSISIWSTEKNKSITMNVQLTNPKYFWIWIYWYSTHSFQILPLSLRRFVGNSSWQGTPADYVGQSMAERYILDTLRLWEGYLLTGKILKSTECHLLRNIYRSTSTSTSMGNGLILPATQSKITNISWQR